MSTDTKADRVLVLLCLYTLAISTFLLLTALLGASWLTLTMMGLPLGSWLAVIGGVCVGWHAAGAPIWRRRRRSGVREHTRLLDHLETRARARRSANVSSSPQCDSDSFDPCAQKRALRDLAPEQAGGIAGLLAQIALSVMPGRPVRVGYTNLPEPDPQRTWPAGFDCQLVPVETADELTSEQVMREHRLDAWVRIERFTEPIDEVCQPHLWSCAAHTDRIDPSGHRGEIARIITPDRPGKPAAEISFGSAPPLWLGAVFPVRVDSGETIVSGLDTAGSAQREALLDFAFALAALSRAPHRLALSDLWSARHPWQASDLSRVIGALLRHEGKTPIHQACARLVAAWFGQSGHAGAHGPWAHGVIEATGRLRAEATALLQRGAAFAANHQFDESVRAFIDAFLRIGAEDLDGVPANLAFLQFHLETQRRHDPAAIGQIAAAVTTLLATAERQTRRYLRQDIEEDLAQAKWLTENEEYDLFLGRLLERLAQLPQDVRNRSLVPAA